MIEKQEKYFVENFDDKYFAIWEYSGKPIEDNVIYSADVYYKDGVEVSRKESGIFPEDEIPEITISMVKADTINLTDYILLREMEPTEDGTVYKILANKKSFTKADRYLVLENYGIDRVIIKTEPNKEFQEYLELSKEEFFEKFKIRTIDEIEMEIKK